MLRLRRKNQIAYRRTFLRRSTDPLHDTQLQDALLAKPRTTAI
jgi:hypothetical protein